MGFGHFGGIGYAIAGQVGKLFKGGKSTEDINFPKRLIFLRDTTVAISMTMMIFFLIVTGVAVANGILDADPTQFSNLNVLLNVGTETTSNWIVWALESGMAFAGGVYIVLSGVRLIVGEIVPAFKGISEKLVPGAIPSIDCPVCFPYAPNAVIIGFLVSFVGGIVGLLILMACSSPSCLPSACPSSRLWASPPLPSLMLTSPGSASCSVTSLRPPLACRCSSSASFASSCRSFTTSSPRSPRLLLPSSICCGGLATNMAL